MDEKRKGLCINFGNCKNADNKIPIELDFSADFVCPECERDLTEIVEKKFWKDPIKKYTTIGAIVFAVIVGGYYTIIQLTKATIVDGANEIVNTTKEAVVDGAGKIIDKTGKAVVETTEKVTDIAKKAVGNTEESHKGTMGQTKTPKPEIKNSSSIAFKTIKLPNGDKYVGEVKNGLMHGAGEYYFSARRLISKQDMKKRYAEKGDILKGSWYKGNFSTGKLFDKNNKFKEVIIIGQR